MKRAHLAGASIAALLAAGASTAVAAATTTPGSDPAPAPGVARHLTGVSTPAQVQAVRDYWTPERMRSAIPAERTRDLPAGAKSRPAQMRQQLAAGDAVQVPAQKELGKIFFSMSGKNYVCSGTATASQNQSIVTTAGHCVNEGPGAYATKLTFVPAYDNGSAPYGEWPATSLLAHNGWVTQGDMNVDTGFATVAKNAQGQTLQQVVGGKEIAFNQARNQQMESYG